MMNDDAIEKFYRGIFADLTVDHEEAQELIDFFNKLNPPPDTLVKLRATAFKIACEFLSDDDNDTNVALMKAVNAIVHALEQSRMVPKELDGTDSFEEDKVSECFTNVFSDLSVDADENTDLKSLFETDSPPPVDKMVWTRATAFKMACDHLSNDRDTNVQLMRCVNVVVHAFEMTCLSPRPYRLQLEVSNNISVASIGLDASLEKAVQHLWDLDMNRMVLGKDLQINVQSGKKPFTKEDAADDPLFTSVDARQFESRPTYRAFIALLDNYSAEAGVAEEVTNVERAEVKIFLKAIMQTAPMQFCHKYCVANASNHAVPSSQEDFIRLLQKIWFDLYKRCRGGREDSSGFEHVFVGEVKDDKVSGFHNWIQLYLEEKRGTLDYRGYIKPKSYNDASTNDDDSVLTLQFAWNGIEKAVGTSFIGTSPEFEVALYTVCFLVGGEDNHVQLNTGHDIFDLNIRCYRMGQNQIGTSFPEATAHYEA